MHNRPAPLNRAILFILVLAWLTTAVIGNGGFFSHHPILSVPALGSGLTNWSTLFLAILLFLGAPLSIVFQRYRWLLLATSVISWLILSVADVNRLQSYILIYLSLFAVLPQTAEDRKRLLSLMLAGIYVISGLHKINPDFAGFTGSIFWFHSLPMNYTPAIGYGFAILEILLGIGLLFRFSRKVTGAFLIVMHLIILWKIGPFKADWNYIVWPWNVVMIAVVFYIAFAKAEKNTAKRRTPLLKLFPIIILFWVLPASNLLGLYPDLLSWHLYTGNDLDGRIRLNRDLLDQKELQTLRLYDRDSTDYTLTWQLVPYSLDERGISIYTEKWVYERIHDNYCQSNPACKGLTYRREAE